MSDETPDTTPVVPTDEVVDAPVADDLGDETPVVPTDPPAGDDAVEQDATLYIDFTHEAFEAAQARVAELEAKVASLESYVQELEDDPYRAPAGDASANGVVTDQLVAFEAQLDEAEIQAWERSTGLTYDDEPVDKVEV